MTSIHIDELAGKKGSLCCYSPWLRVTQEMIWSFADVTGDNQWIHVDVDRSKIESPWKDTVAHGYLTLSLVAQLNSKALTVTGSKAVINYGLNRLRFPTAVIANSEIRTKVLLVDIENIDSQKILATYQTTVEIKDNNKPACVVENIVMYVI